MSEVRLNVEELKIKIKELKEFSALYNIDLSEEIKKIEDKIKSQLKKESKGYTPWEKVTIARMATRPTSLDYIEKIFDGFIEFHGDRLFGDDAALVAGLAKLDGMPVTVIAQQKGRNIKDNIYRNFGMMKPEGYRKALRLMKQAEKFKRPIICFIDTPGAFCGVEAEERGQGEAIAKNLMEMSGLKSQIISVVIGEGGSGGALGLAVADKVYMLEHAVYSVISPEGCASILLKDSKRAMEAADILKITAQDLSSLGIIDGIIPEAPGGAHNGLHTTAEAIKKALKNDLNELVAKPMDALLDERYNKFRKIK